MQLRRTTYHRLITALFWLPVVFTFFYVCFCGVNLPWHDEWDAYVPLMIHYQQNALTLGEFWAPHNEHRLFLPKLLTMATAIPSGYDTRLPMILTQLFMFAGFLLLILKINRDAVKVLDKYPLWILLVPMLFYSGRQFDNFLWGLQLCFFMTTTFVIASGYFLSRSFCSENNLYRYWIFQFLALLFAVSASLCMPNGLFAWAAAFVQLLIAICSQRKHYLRLGLAIFFWLVIASITWFVYFYGSPLHPTGGVSLKRITLSLAYFTGYVGSALNPEYLFAIPIGLFLLCSFGYILIRMFKDKSLLKYNFWIGLSTFSMLSGLAIAWARAEPFGIRHSSAGRYVTFSILFVISLYVLLFSFEESSLYKTSAINRYSMKFIHSITISLIIISIFWGTLLQGFPRGFASHANKTQLVKILKEFELHSDEELQAMCDAGGAVVRERASLLKKYKISVFRK